MDKSWWPAFHAHLRSHDSDKPWILVFFLLVASVGAPIWYYTTAVHRAPLPHNEIRSRWNVNDMELRFPVHWVIHHPRDRILQLSLRSVLIDHQSFAEHQADLGPAESMGPSIAVKSVLLDVTLEQRPLEDDLERLAAQQAEEEFLNRLPEHLPSADEFYHVYIVEKPNIKTWYLTIGRERSMVLSLPRGMPGISSLLNEVLTAVHSHDFSAIVRSLSPQESQFTQMAIKYSAEFELSLSLLNGASLNASYDWDIDLAAKKYLGAFLSRIRLLSNVRLSSQIVRFATLNIDPEWNEGELRHEISLAKVPYFINSDWKIASSVTNCTELHFILFIPARNMTPLHISSHSSDNSILIPQWGGALIYNPSPASTSKKPSHRNVSNVLVVEKHKLSVRQLKPVFQVFLWQLRQLLGILPVWPETRDAHRITEAFKLKIHSLDHRAGLTTWEMDKLLRSRLAENILTTSNTLNSLSRMLLSMKNMVVGEVIQSGVQEALYHLDEAFKYTNPSLNTTENKRLALLESFAHSRQAVLAAERVFFDPTMIAMLYFPDEHLYAVYAPLFLPALVPVLFSIIRLVKKPRPIQALSET